MGLQCVVEWLKALGFPALTMAISFLAVAVSGLTCWLACWQMRIAKEKLRHDLYDRRYAVYMAFHELLVAIVEKSDVESELRTANAARAQCPFLLDEETGDFLEELHKEVFRIAKESELLVNVSYSGQLSPPEHAIKSAQLSHDRLNLCNRIKNLSKKFEPFLKLKDFS